MVRSVALSRDGKLVLTGSLDHTAILWEAASGKEIQTFLGHTDAVGSVALSRDGKHVLTGSSDLTAVLWDAASGQKIQTFQGGQHQLDLCRRPERRWQVRCHRVL